MSWMTGKSDQWQTIPYKPASHSYQYATDCPPIMLGALLVPTVKEGACYRVAATTPSLRTTRTAQGNTAQLRILAYLPRMAPASDTFLSQYIFSNISTSLAAPISPAADICQKVGDGHENRSQSGYWRTRAMQQTDLLQPPQIFWPCMLQDVHPGIDTCLLNELALLLAYVQLIACPASDCRSRQPRGVEGSDKRSHVIQRHQGEVGCCVPRARQSDGISAVSARFSLPER